MEGSYEYDNEPSGSIKCWEILEYLTKLVASQEGLSSMELVSLLVTVAALGNMADIRYMIRSSLSS
jgi:hypothetical protein